MISLICSDIHGDALAATRLEELIHAYHPDRVLLLGDLFYSGIRLGLPSTYDPEKTLTILNRYADIILAVRGNCDRQEDLAKAHFECPESRHLRHGTHLLFLFHDARALEFPLNPSDILLTGHTHIGFLAMEKGVVFANPGSLAWPRDAKGPTFMLLDERKLSLLGYPRSLISCLPIL